MKIWTWKKLCSNREHCMVSKACQTWNVLNAANLKCIHLSFSVCIDQSPRLRIGWNVVYSSLPSPIQSGQIKDLPAFKQMGLDVWQTTRNRFQSLIARLISAGVVIIMLKAEIYRAIRDCVDKCVFACAWILMTTSPCLSSLPPEARRHRLVW